MSKVLLPVLVLGCLLISATAFAQPQEAFDACDGKQSGDPCQVGPGDGTCQDHGRGAFCIPEGHMRGGGRPDGPPQQSGMNQGPPDTDMSGVGMNAQSQGRPPRQGGRGDRMQEMMQGQGRKPNKYPSPGSKSSYEETTPIRTGGAFDTAQTLCFNESRVISCPEPGEKFYGQDAQYQGIPLSYTDNADGTVTDNNTGLTWEQGHNEERLPQYKAAEYCSNLKLGGYDDWRLPNAKELYSLMTFDGAAGVKPYISTEYFELREPESLDEKDRFASTHSPEMMGQTWTSTIYTGNLWGRNQETAFFVNMLDGRIKCAPTGGRMGQFYRCVRGEEYGENELQANGDGTVTDHSTGLVWQEADDGRTRDWPEALAYCEGLELAGHDDWRLPNAKELQYMLDYTRIPATPRELKQSDPAAWYWTGTTLGDDISSAVYVCFGKCIAYDGTDVHGAGGQRSDPKTSRMKRSDRMGGQQDDVRGENLVRCVRN